MGISGSSLTNALGSVPVIGPVVDIGAAIGGLFGGNQEPDGRYASNATAYQQALAGNPDALKALKGHAGLGAQTLSGPIPGLPTYQAGKVITAWPADGPKADALNKYQMVISAAGQGSGGAAEAMGADPGTIGKALETASNTIAGLPAWAALAGAALLGFALVKIARR